MLCPVELRPQRRRLELNQRERALQARALPLGHVVKKALIRIAIEPRAYDCPLKRGRPAASEAHISPLFCSSAPRRDRTCRLSVWSRAFLHW